MRTLACAAKALRACTFAAPPARSGVRPRAAAAAATDRASSTSGPHQEGNGSCPAREATPSTVPAEPPHSAPPPPPPRRPPDPDPDANDEFRLGLRRLAASSTATRQVLEDHPGLLPLFQAPLRLVRAWFAVQFTQRAVESDFSEAECVEVRGREG